MDDLMEWKLKIVDELQVSDSCWSSKFQFVFYINKNIVIKNFYYLGLLMMIMSCSGSIEDSEAAIQIHTYEYSVDELNLMCRINDYRESKGFSKLSIVDYISYLSAQHNQSMIQKKLVNHNGFSERSNDLMQLYGVVKVSENVAYNYKSNKAVLEAWLNSPSHNKNIEGDFTHFGLSISKDTISGKKFYTNIFVKYPP